jgi:hypothetical protein
MSETRDIPIILQSVTQTDDYEGDFTTRQTLIYALSFIMKNYIYGPVVDSEIIRTVKARTYIEGGSGDISNTAAAGRVGEQIITPNPGDADPDDVFTYNETTNLIATVVSVDSDTQLTLSAAIFLAIGDEYTVYQANPEPNAFLLYVGTAGNLSIQTSLDRAAILTNVGNASFIPIGVGRVNSTGTTALDIVALI